MAGAFAKRNLFGRILARRNTRTVEILGRPHKTERNIYCMEYRLRAYSNIVEIGNEQDSNWEILSLNFQ